MGSVGLFPLRRVRSSQDIGQRGHRLQGPSCLARHAMRGSCVMNGDIGPCWELQEEAELGEREAVRVSWLAPGSHPWASHIPEAGPALSPPIEVPGKARLASVCQRSGLLEETPSISAARSSLVLGSRSVAVVAGSLRVPGAVPCHVNSTTTRPATLQSGFLISACPGLLGYGGSAWI